MSNAAVKKGIRVAAAYIIEPFSAATWWLLCKKCKY
jgi:hypothetical protein